MDIPNGTDKEKKENPNPAGNTGQAPEGFGNVIDALHNKGKLSSLRSYQGDMAEFIKERNESTISIAVKEKERKEEREEKAKKEEKEEDKKEKPESKEKNKEEKKEEKTERKKEEKGGFSLKIPVEKPVVQKEGFKINLTVAVLSLLLITGGVVASLYIYKFIKEVPKPEVVIKTGIIPYNNTITLANLTGATIGEEIAKLSPANGITILKISDTDGSVLRNIQDLLDFLNVSLPGTLARTLKPEYFMGVISQDDQASSILILSVNDFGQAFSGMLDWEENMPKDLSFLSGVNTVAAVPVASKNTASTTAATSTAVVVAAPITPVSQGPFVWKDLIIKNKDTRAFVNSKDQAKLAYTFLDKNTILITNSLWAIGEVSSAYASRSIAR